MKVYINEALTPETAAIYYQARQLVKERKLCTAYTLDGQVFAKATKEQKKGQKIERMEQLAYFTETTSTRNANSDPDGRQILDLSKLSKIQSSVHNLLPHNDV